MSKYKIFSMAIVYVRNTHSLDIYEVRQKGKGKKDHQWQCSVYDPTIHIVL